MKTKFVVLHYNVPEVTDRLVENLFDVIPGFLKEDLVVVDNGSLPDHLSKYTTMRLETNVRMTNGFNAGLDSLRNSDVDLVWLFTSDCYFQSENNPLENMSNWMLKYPEIGILHPALDQRVKVCFDVKKQEGTLGLKVVSEYDFVCPMFSRRALDVLGWQFDPKLFYGWGVDYETSYLVRQAGMKVCINHDLTVMHETSTTYDRSRDVLCTNRDQFYDLAGKNMREVLTGKYGPAWHQLFINTNNDGVGTWKH